MDALEKAGLLDRCCTSQGRACPEHSLSARLSSGCLWAGGQVQPHNRVIWEGVCVRTCGMSHWIHRPGLAPPEPCVTLPGNQKPQTRAPGGTWGEATGWVGGLAGSLCPVVGFTSTELAPMACNVKNGSQIRKSSDQAWYQRFLPGMEPSHSCSYPALFF